MIQAILDTYNCGNLLNMVSLSALLAEPSAPPAGRRPKAPLPSTKLTIPLFPEVADLSDKVSEQVLTINGLGAKPRPNQVVASIYKHAALWPSTKHVLTAKAFQEVI